MCVKQPKTLSKKTHPGDREREGLNSGGVAREVDEEGGGGGHLLLHGQVERPHSVWVHHQLGGGEHTSRITASKVLSWLKFLYPMALRISLSMNIQR